ncbi:MAG: YajQ family cyclic di-GMP-binding protein [Peptococcaceae bacterium]|nr:YajQ family cyclic di-GMP-binding protein [Peptococcaceae bacterium]
MAKDATFDIVSEVNLAEVTNAVNQAEKEISQRYDFKGIQTEIALDKDQIKITTADDMHLKSVIDILQSKFIKRQVPIDNLEYGKTESAAGGAVRQVVTIKQGIEKDLAKKITKDVKDSKLKVQTQYMDDKIRVSGKKIDDLQAVIAKLQENDYGISLQFNNFRS